MAKTKLKPGDRVVANPLYPYRWDREEIKQGKMYPVSECHRSEHYGPYVQLKEVYSSYPVDSLVLVRGRK